MTVAVIGAGSPGLAVLAALRRHGVAADGFERGAQLGGLWRYDNDNGLSSAYASLRTNVSRTRMQYPSFPMPGSYGDFPHHRDMAAYLEAYADAFGLRERVRFGVTVERVEPDPDGGWMVALDDGSARRYRAVVVAIGLFWSPKLPDEAAGFAGRCATRTTTAPRRPSPGGACWWWAAASRPPRSPWRSPGWRRGPACRSAAASTWSRAGSAAAPTTGQTSSR
jgi:cation diffusion facilitator CzcD-associated flavoprotein CzcO